MAQRGTAVRRVPEQLDEHLHLHRQLRVVAWRQRARGRQQRRGVAAFLVATDRFGHLAVPPRRTLLERLGCPAFSFWSPARRGFLRRHVRCRRRGRFRPRPRRCCACPCACPCACSGAFLRLALLEQLVRQPLRQQVPQLRRRRHVARVRRKPEVMEGAVHVLVHEARTLHVHAAQVVGGVGVAAGGEVLVVVDDLRVHVLAPLGHRHLDVRQLQPLRVPRVRAARAQRADLLGGLVGRVLVVDLRLLAAFRHADAVQVPVPHAHARLRVPTQRRHVLQHQRPPRVHLHQGAAVDAGGVRRRQTVLRVRVAQRRRAEQEVVAFRHRTCVAAQHARAFQHVRRFEQRRRQQLVPRVRRQRRTVELVAVHLHRGAQPANHLAVVVRGLDGVVLRGVLLRHPQQHRHVLGGRNGAAAFTAAAATDTVSVAAPDVCRGDQKQPPQLLHRR